VSAHSDILLYHSLILLELFDDYESFLCSHVIFIHFLVLVEFGAYSRFVSPLLVLIVWIIFKLLHFIQLLFTFCCVVINHQKGGRLCASRPSRYVSMINDNHLVSLMNFNAAKVN
jgi:hypothetical protein